MFCLTVMLQCNVCAVARSVFRRDALLTRGDAAIAGLAAAVHEAQRVRDMREYPFRARLAESDGAVSITAPGKILRDSPTRRGTPKSFLDETVY